MKHSDFIKSVAAGSALTQEQVKQCLKNAAYVIHDQVNLGEEVVVKGIGKFSKKRRAERIGKNPATGEKVAIPAKDIVLFKADKEFKDFINK